MYESIGPEYGERSNRPSSLRLALPGARTRPRSSRTGVPLTASGAHFMRGLLQPQRAERARWRARGGEGLSLLRPSPALVVAGRLGRAQRSRDRSLGGVWPVYEFGAPFLDLSLRRSLCSQRAQREKAKSDQWRLLIDGAGSWDSGSRRMVQAARPASVPHSSRVRRASLPIMRLDLFCCYLLLRE